MRWRLLVGPIAMIGFVFLLGFIASRGLFGPHGWAVALIAGAAICAGVGVVLTPLRHNEHRFHLLRRR